MSAVNERRLEERCQITNNSGRQCVGPRGLLICEIATFYRKCFWAANRNKRKSTVCRMWWSVYIECRRVRRVGKIRVRVRQGQEEITAAQWGVVDQEVTGPREPEKWLGETVGSKPSLANFWPYMLASFLPRGLSHPEDGSGSCIRNLIFLPSTQSNVLEDSVHHKASPWERRIWRKY